MDPEKKETNFVPVNEVKDVKHVKDVKKLVPKKAVVKKALAKIAKKVIKTTKKAKEIKMNGKNVGRKGFYPPKMKTELYNLYQKNHSLKEDVLGPIKAKYPEAKKLNRNRAWSIISAMMKKNGTKVHKVAKVKKMGRPAGKVGRPRKYAMTVRSGKYKNWEEMDKNERTAIWTHDDLPTTKLVNVRVGGILFKVDSSVAKKILASLMENE